MQRNEQLLPGAPLCGCQAAKGLPGAVAMGCQGWVVPVASSDVRVSPSLH
jgi:hypothetical protein